MADYNQKRQDFKPIIKGSVCSGQTFQINVNGSPACDLTNAAIDIWVREKNSSGKIIQKYSSNDDSQIEITDAANCEFAWLPFLTDDYFVGDNYYDIRIQTPSFGPKYYIYGIIPIINRSTGWTLSS
jgi:hypothetical protein